MTYQYNRSVVLSQIPSVIRWLQSKADEAGSSTVQVSGLDCAVAADLIEGLRAEVEHLHAEIAAMRPMVAVLAEACDGETESIRFRVPNDTSFAEGFDPLYAWHLIERAREFIAQYPQKGKEE